MLRLWFSFALWLTCAGASADFVSLSPQNVELTVYRPGGSRELSLDEESDGIAMITETRTIEIPRGASVIRFRGVADAIVPQTAKLEGAAATVVEANFDYNLLTPGTLLAKSLGRPVRLVRTNPSTGQVTERRGVLRSAPDGVLIDFDGEIEALKCSGLNERLVFDDVPESLTDTPTLSMLVRAPEGGRFEVRLSYLALGLDWSADYVARIHPDGRRLDLSAWLTLVNRYGTHFTDATAHVVAGNLARDEETQPPKIETPKQQDHCWPIGEFRVIRAPLAPPAPRRELERNYMSMNSAALQEIVVTGSYVAKVSQLGDYKLYSLPVATTVAPRQMKQVRMLEQENVRFERLYEYEIEESARPESLPRDRPWVLLRLENKERNGLGVPLPGGRVAVMESDASGKQILAGENTIEDTPVGLPFDIHYAKAMDVWVTPHIVEDVRREQAGGAMVQRSLEVEIANDKPTAVTLEVVHRPYSAEDFRVVSESRRHEMKYGAARWSIRLRPGQRYVLRYAIEHRA